MSVSIESFSFGNVQFMTTPSDLEGFTGGVALSTDSFAVSEIQVGAKVEVDSKTFKVLDYLVTQRDASNKITKAKVIAWTCDAEGNVVMELSMQAEETPAVTEGQAEAAEETAEE